MALLSQGVKDRITTVLNVGKTAFHWGFIPTIIYLGMMIIVAMREQEHIFSCLGFQKGAEPGMPELTPASLLWA